MGIKIKTILVTGGCGFIGSAFIRYVLDHTGYGIINVDKITYAARPISLSEYVDNPRYSFHKVDICDISKVAGVAKDVDYIVHFAAETHVDRSIGVWENKNAEKERWGSQLDPFINTNMIGTQALLELTRQNMFSTKTMLEVAKGNLRIKKFVQISTDEVYGPSNERCPEDSKFNARNPYAATKVGGEALANSYYHTFGVPICITRSCNNFGPWQGSEKFIPVATLSALSDTPIPIYGTGENVRDWIHVEDNVRAVLLVMEQGEPGEAYNIPADNFRTNLEMASLILESLGKPQSLIKLVQDRPGHDSKYAMTGSKISERCGWSTRMSLEGAIEKTVEFYMEHEEYFKDEQKRAGVEERVKSLLKDAK